MYDDLAFSKVSCRFVPPEQCKASYCNMNGENHQSVLPGTPATFSLHTRHDPHSDFLLFGSLKEFLCVSKFLSDDELKSKASKLLKTQSKDFYAEEIQNLSFRGEKMCFKVCRLRWKIKQFFLVDMWIVILQNSHYLLNEPRIYIYIYIYISKVGDRSRGPPEGPLFISYYTEALSSAQLLFLDSSTLPLICTLLC